MINKACPHCGKRVGLGAFKAAITGGRARLRCPHCEAVIKRDISLFSGLFYFGFSAVFFPVLVIFGMGKSVAGRVGERIQQIFEVGPGAALAIGIGVILGFVLLYLVIALAIFWRLEFDPEVPRR